MTWRRTSEAWVHRQAEKPYLNRGADIDKGQVRRQLGHQRAPDGTQRRRFSRPVCVCVCERLGKFERARKGASSGD